MDELEEKSLRERIRDLGRDRALILKVVVFAAVVFGVLYVTSFERFEANMEAGFGGRFR